MVFITVRGLSGETVAELLTGPHRSLADLKVQIAGIEGTPISNQTLLLSGRAVADGLTLADIGVRGSVTLTLVQCEPLLSGNLTPQDVWRMLEDERALEQAIDAYKEDPQYDVAEINEIVGRLASSLLPSDTSIAPDILSNLPLNLLADDDAQSPSADTGVVAEPHVWEDASADWWSALDVSAKSSKDANASLASEADCTAVVYFEIDAEPVPSFPRRRERRERFTSCVRAALEVLWHAMQEERSTVAKAGAGRLDCMREPLGCVHKGNPQCD